MDTIETFNYSENGIDFSVNVVCFNTNDTFGDEWELTDNHQGGITVKNPNAESLITRSGSVILLTSRGRAPALTRGKQNGNIID